MIAVLDALTPSLVQLAGLGGLVVVMAGFSTLGACAGGRRRLPEGDLVYGWALVALLFTVTGALRLVPFTAIAAAALALALGAAVWLIARRRPPVAPPLLRIALVSLPLVLVVTAMQPSQWDEFTNWLPNARYLVENDAFPARDLPANPSVFPAYPYGLPLVIYLASRVAGHFVENAAALFNLFLLLSLGLLAVRVARTALGRPAADDTGAGWPWGWCALGVLAATALSPTFVTKIAFTAYADTGTAVTLGFAAALGWMALNAQADGRPDDARAAAWQMGLAATALIALKQVNLVLLAALAAALLLAALRDPALRLRPLARLAVPALALPLAVFLVWRGYVAANIPGGEFTIRPMADWSLSLIPVTLARMALIASKKGGYFGIMLVAVAFAVAALWRPRGAFGRLAVIAGGTFVAYNGFLLFAYVAAFGEYEARYALSYWRYNTHLGGLCLLFAAHGVASLWRRGILPRFDRPLGWLAILLAVAAPIVAAPRLRFDTRPRYEYARTTGADIAALLTPGDRLVLVDPEDDGQYLVIMRYRMHGSATVAGEVTAFAARTPAGVRAAVERARPTHLWLYRPLPTVEAALGVTLRPGASYLLKKTGDGWTTLRAWPHPAPAR